MKSDKREREFLDQVTKGLDCGLKDLDPSVRERLREGRLQALSALGEPRQGWFALPRLVPAAGLATLAALALAGSLWFSRSPQQQVSRAEDEMEVLTVQGNLDMYQDLEFYRWLARTNEKG